MSLLKYSNGWGHLLMSVVATATGLALVLWPTTDAPTKAFGSGIIMMVNGTWFLSGAVNQVATAVVNQLSTASTPAPAPAPESQTTQPIKVVLKGPTL